MKHWSLNVHDVVNWFTADGEKRVSIHVSFSMRNKKRCIANVLPVEVKFDEDGDLVNGSDYFSAVFDTFDTGKRNYRTLPIEFLIESDAVRITLEAYVKSAIEISVESLTLLNELELFNRRNAIDYALKHKDKKAFERLTSIEAVF